MYRFWTWLSEFVDRRLIKTAPVMSQDEWVASVEAAAERWTQRASDISLEDWKRAAIDRRPWR